MLRWRWAGLATVVILAGLFAYLNGGERVTIDFGFATLYRISLVGLVFTAFLLGMTVMFVAGIEHDLRVRRMLRDQRNEPPRLPAGPPSRPAAPAPWSSTPASPPEPSPSPSSPAPSQTPSDPSPSPSPSPPSPAPSPTPSDPSPSPSPSPSADAPPSTPLSDRPPAPPGHSP
jgi:uncharacterized integral membrane protein